MEKRKMTLLDLVRTRKREKEAAALEAAKSDKVLYRELLWRADAPRDSDPDKLLSLMSRLGLDERRVAIDVDHVGCCRELLPDLDAIEGLERDLADVSAEAAKVHAKLEAQREKLHAPLAAQQRELELRLQRFRASRDALARAVTEKPDLMPPELAARVAMKD